VKPKRKIKRRNRRETRFAILSQSDRVWELMLYGRELSDIEQIVFAYRHAKEAASTQETRLTTAEAFADLCADAQKRGDTKKQRKIARALKNVKNFRHGCKDCFIDYPHHVALLLKSLQTPTTTPGKAPTLPVREILEMAYPRRNYPRLSDKNYADMLASHARTMRRRAKRIGLQLAPPGAPRKKLDK
jgi:hypothetical protein